MLDIKNLEVGKTYRHVAGKLHPYFNFTKDVFTVYSIDEDGDVATLDSTWRGASRETGWFITDEDADSCLTSSTGILKFEEVVE
jgi:hypothetical protein